MIPAVDITFCDEFIPQLLDGIDIARVENIDSIGYFKNCLFIDFRRDFKSKLI